VYDDYSLEVVLPSSDATVSAASATIHVEMQNVSSLEVNGKKSDDIIITTGLNDEKYKNIKLSEYLSSCYHFGGATVNIDIDGARCAYEFAAIDSANTIVGKPTSIEATRAAWQKMVTGNIKTSTGSGTSITIDNESLLVLGSSILMFAYEGDEFGSGLKDDLVLTTSTTKEQICDAVALYTLDKEDYTGPGIYAYLGADTALSVDKSCATLLDGVNITVEGIDLSKEYNNTDLSNVLDNLRKDVDGGNGSTATIVLDLVTIFDAVVNAVDTDTNNVTVTLDFGACSLFADIENSED
jgi:hypothetical protein